MYAVMMVFECINQTFQTLIFKGGQLVYNRLYFGDTFTYSSSIVKSINHYREYQGSGRNRKTEEQPRGAT